MRAFVDQINGNMVTLLIGVDEKEAVVISSKLIPFDVCEGDVLQLLFAVDKDSHEEAESAVSEILDQLGDNP